MLGRLTVLPLLLFPIYALGDVRSCNEVLENVDSRADFFVGNISSKLVRKREVDPIFVGHPKTKSNIVQYRQPFNFIQCKTERFWTVACWSIRIYTERNLIGTKLYTVDNIGWVDYATTSFCEFQEEIWYQNFKIEGIIKIDDVLIQLIVKLAEIYLKDCIPIILYDRFVEESDGVILQKLFQNISLTYIHGKIDHNYKLMNKNILQPLDTRCRSYVLFLSDILRARDILGPQTTSRVVIVSRSTQWKQLEFLSSKSASDLINLIVIGESVGVDTNKDHPFVLYTHRLYTDGLGSNLPVVLTSWLNKKLSRPHLNLFPRKFLKGFAGHRFTISGYHKPPYVVKKLSTDTAGNTVVSWDGFEFRVMKLLSQRLNFTYDIIEPVSKNKLGPTYGVIDDVYRRRADIGVAGAYVASERLYLVEMSTQHSSDCASFITLASKALPRYRAIMGPFQWPVWVAITSIYLLAIFPLAFSDKLTLSHLIGNWSEIENMFWYVFGTFTNSLTFTGRNSWSSTKKSSTRMLIGWYWVFTIIVTACYTSSIIAFVTLPIFPETVDTISGLLNGFYRVGTLENDGWQFWFLNSSHAQTSKLMKNLEFVVDVEEGLSNVTKAWFWPYAFIGSKAQLEFIVRDNYTDEVLGKRSALHIAEECLSIYGVAYMYPKDVVYAERMNDAILRLQAFGISHKMLSEMEWDLQRKSKKALLKSSGAKTFKVTEAEERGLTLADTEGMFLLMGIGYLVAASVLISEAIGGCANKCRKIARRASTASIAMAESMMSHPNSMKTHQTDEKDDSLGSGVIFPTSRNNSSDSILRRRQSEQISGRFKVTRRGHQRHNSLIEPEHIRTLNSTSISMLSVDGINVNESIDNSFKSTHTDNGVQEHAVEINRVQTPFRNIDENFGERVVH